MSATSEGGAPHEGRPTARADLQRTNHLAQDSRGHLAIERGVLQLLVPEQHLDDADVDLLLQQMGGERVAQGYAATRACRSRPPRRRVDGAIELPRSTSDRSGSGPGTTTRGAASCPRHGPRATRPATARARSARASRSDPCGPCPARHEWSCARCRCRRPSARRPRWRADPPRRPPTAPRGDFGFARRCDQPGDLLDGSDHR